MTAVDEIAPSSTASDLDALAAWASDFSLADLPGELLPTLRGCVLYGLAVGMATLRVPPAQMICRTLDLDGPPAGSSVRLLDGVASSASNAALANGVLLSGRVQGDSHACGHIGGVVIPTALAVAQHGNLSGAEMLASLVAGYETGLRIGRDHSKALSERGFRTTPVYGVFAAAAVAARGLGLDAATTRNALSVSANLAGGLREYVTAGTDESPFQAGFAARAGVSAAQLVSTGLNAAGSALHGPAGFYSAYGGAASDHGTRLAVDLGRQFEFPEVTYKPHPACVFLRGMIHGVAALRAQAGEGAVLEELEVRLCPFEAEFLGIRYAGPFSAASQTTMSAPFCAALTWATGTVGYATLREFDNPAVLELVPKVRIVADPNLGQYETHLRLELADGRTLRDVSGPGDGDYKVRWDEVVPVAWALCAEVGVPAELIEAFIEAVGRVDTARDVSEVVGAVRDMVRAAS
ncbi:MmgE/PrpD family protein [Pseudonocardia lutea]|uniref:MmgE/PrpD family protein n=1 Tax=Pseudonocardia lutea TaxID=2172015 RepID=A0ABW1IIU6_9PSEU